MLLDLEEAGLVVDCMEALETGLQDIQIIGVGYVLDI